MAKVTSLLAGMISGAIVGAVGSLLFTPYSGRELQARVREQLDTMRDDARYAAQSRRAELEAQLESLKSPAGPEPEREMVA